MINSSNKYQRVNIFHAHTKDHLKIEANEVWNKIQIFSAEYSIVFETMMKSSHRAYIMNCMELIPSNGKIIWWEILLPEESVKGNLSAKSVKEIEGSWCKSLERGWSHIGISEPHHSYWPSILYVIFHVIIKNN